jgi:hypothetical protein
MKESVTYQAILREGEALAEARAEARGALREARAPLPRFGRHFLGDPTEDQQNLINSITDLDHLHRLRDNLPRVKTWQELLQTP